MDPSDNQELAILKDYSHTPRSQDSPSDEDEDEKKDDKPLRMPDSDDDLEEQIDVYEEDPVTGNKVLSIDKSYSMTAV